MTPWVERLRAFDATPAIKIAGLALLGLALAVGAWGIAADAASVGSRQWVRYTSWLDRSLRAMFVFTPGRQIAITQALALFLLAAYGLVIDLPGWPLGILAVLLGPWLWIKRLQAERVRAAEAQLCTFLQSLANALRASPSIGAALGSIASSLRAPLRDEVELALKEINVGSALDQSLLNMAVRVRSRPLDAAVASILIGRRVGGDLPRILDANAAALRETFRLESVLKAKTADARNQLLVLTLLPVAAVAGISVLSPGYFDLLSASVEGYAVAAAGGGLWVGSLLVARGVLAVKL